MLMSHGGRRRFSGPVQGDAAAKVGEDQGRGGGGGARALERQRRKTREKGVTKAYGPGLFIRVTDKWARETRRPRRDYLATETPRFSGWSLKIRSVGI